MLEKEMLEAAESLDFEQAARLRDRIKELKDAPELVVHDDPAADPPRRKSKKGKGFRPRRTRA